MTVFLHNLSLSFLWSTSWPGTLHFIFHTFCHPITVFLILNTRKFNQFNALQDCVQCQYMWQFLPRNTMPAWYMLSSCVCVSVTCRYCVKKAKLRITQTTAHDSLCVDRIINHRLGVTLPSFSATLTDLPVIFSRCVSNVKSD